MSDLKAKLKEIIELDWQEEDKAKFEEMIKNVMYYRLFLSKTLEKDIINCLNICIKEKRELDDLRRRLSLI